jgi:hypothetical protein
MTNAQTTTTTPEVAPIQNLRDAKKELAAKKPASEPKPEKAAKPEKAPKPPGEPKVNKNHALDDAIVRASWEMPVARIRELAGLADLTDEAIVARIDHHMKYHSPRCYSDGKRVTA